MGSVNVSGRRKAVKRKRNRILPGHARRAYERTKQHLQEQTEDAGETAYESSDKVMSQIRQGITGDLAPLFHNHHTDKPDQANTNRRGSRVAVNVAGFHARDQKSIPHHAGANDAVRRTAAKQFSAKNASGKKQRFQRTKQTLRRAAQGVSNSVRSILSAAKNLILSLSAGGWVVAILGLIICRCVLNLLAFLIVLTFI